MLKTALFGITCVLAAALLIAGESKDSKGETVYKEIYEWQSDGDHSKCRKLSEEERKEIDEKTKKASKKLEKIIERFEKAVEDRDYRAFKKCFCKQTGKKEQRAREIFEIISAGKNREVKCGSGYESTRNLSTSSEPAKDGKPAVHKIDKANYETNKYKGYTLHVWFKYDGKEFLVKNIFLREE